MKVLKKVVFAVVVSLIFSSLAIASYPEQMDSGFYWPIGRSQYESKTGWWLNKGFDGGSYVGTNYYHLAVDMMTNLDSDYAFPVSNGEIIDISYDINWGTGNICAVVRHQTASGESFLAFYGHIRLFDGYDLGSKVWGGIPFAKYGPYSGGVHLHFGININTDSLPAKYGIAYKDSWPNQFNFVEPKNFLQTHQANPEADAEEFIDWLECVVEKLSYCYDEDSAKILGWINENKSFLDSEEVVSQFEVTYQEADDFEITTLTNPDANVKRMRIRHRSGIWKEKSYQAYPGEPLEVAVFINNRGNETIDYYELFLMRSDDYNFNKDSDYSYGREEESSDVDPGEEDEKRRNFNAPGVGTYILYAYINRVDGKEGGMEADWSSNYSRNDDPTEIIVLTVIDPNQDLDNEIVLNPEPETVQISWSSAGPINGMHNIQIVEPSDPHTWNDNFLATSQNFGFKWSYSGSIPGMKCTWIVEFADKDYWEDNYLCVPEDSMLELAWSAVAPINGMNNTRIIETADGDYWEDNYLGWKVNIDPNTTDDDNDGFSENQGDCNDSNSSIHPNAEDICEDGIDQNCNGTDSICPPEPKDVDDDNDGYTENQGDCNDSDSSIYPGAEEICGDNIDQDCDGVDEVCEPELLSITTGIESSNGTITSPKETFNVGEEIHAVIKAGNVEDQSFEIEVFQNNSFWWIWGPGKEIDSWDNTYAPVISTTDETGTQTFKAYLTDGIERIFLGEKTVTIIDEPEPEATDYEFVNIVSCENLIWNGEPFWNYDVINPKDTFPINKTFKILVTLKNISINHRIEIEVFQNDNLYPWWIWGEGQSLNQVVGVWGNSYALLESHGDQTGTQTFKAYLINDSGERFFLGEKTVSVVVVVP